MNYNNLSCKLFSFVLVEDMIVIYKAAVDTLNIGIKNVDLKSHGQSSLSFSGHVNDLKLDISNSVLSAPNGMYFIIKPFPIL